MALDVLLKNVPFEQVVYRILVHQNIFRFLNFLRKGGTVRMSFKLIINEDDNVFNIRLLFTVVSLITPGTGFFGEKGFELLKHKP